MTSRPHDTSPEAWAVQRASLARMTGEERVRIAIEMSESVRAIRIAGIRSRHPGWDASQVIRHLVAEDYGIELPEPE